MARRRYARSDPFAPRRFEPLEPPTAPEAMRRRGRVSIEVSPITHQVPPRPGYRREDDPRFFIQRPAPGMQGYGDPEDTHTRDGNLALQHAELSMTSGVAHAKNGNCAGGRRFLNNAHAAVGAAVAHSKSGGRVSAITMVASSLDNAEEHFSRACPIKRRK